MALGLRERPDKIKVKGLETVIGDIERGQRSLDMPGYFRPLARNAGTTKSFDAGRHSSPHKTAPQVTKRSIASGVGDVVETRDNPGSHGGRHNWSGMGGGE